MLQIFFAPPPFAMVILGVNALCFSPYFLKELVWCLLYLERTGMGMVIEGDIFFLLGLNCDVRRLVFILIAFIVKNCDLVLKYESQW